MEKSLLRWKRHIRQDRGSSSRSPKISSFLNIRSALPLAYFCIRTSVKTLGDGADDDELGPLVSLARKDLKASHNVALGYQQKDSTWLAKTILGWVDGRIDNSYVNVVLAKTSS